jgi:methylmalonyl-CoA mutase N-terminal domain/subunit
MSDSGKSWTTASGIPLEPYYSAAEAGGDTELPPPGTQPYVRGSYRGMYRTKPWRIFQLSGYGSPEQEGERIRFLLEHGETGFIMEHDRNTADHMYDVDHPEVMARKEDVGMTGAVIQSVRDYETVLRGIPIEQTYGHAGGGVVQHAPFALGCYWTVARRRGLDLATLPGTGQSDYFLTYHACVTKQQVPTRTGLRFNADIIEFCVEHMPRWVPVSIAGYNGAETGLNGYQEVAAVMANAVEYLDEIKRRGRVSLTEAARGVGGVSFRVSMDLFEDAAKLRAARKVWHDLLVRRYGITDPKAQMLRIHSLTAGSAMTYQQPLNNIVRGALMALAGVLGGSQSMGVSGYDEAISIPSEHAHQTNLRIQQILQEETNICAVADPLGGSYYVEALTREIEEKTWAFFEEIQQQGGFLESLDSGWLHARAHENQVADQLKMERGEKRLVGVNVFEDDVSPFEIDGFRSGYGEWDNAKARLDELRATRDEALAGAARAELERVCRSDENIMPAMMAAVDAEVSLGEVGELWRSVFGDWDTPIDL